MALEALDHHLLILLVLIELVGDGCAVVEELKQLVLLLLVLEVLVNVVAHTSLVPSTARTVVRRLLALRRLLLLPGHLVQPAII